MQLQPKEFVVIAFPEEHDLAGCALAEEALRSFGELRFRAHGTSMLPAIWPSDVLRVKAIPSREALVGQVWLSRQRGRLVVHRIVRLGEDGMRTVVCRGDFLEWDDPALPPEGLLGLVTHRERRGAVQALSYAIRKRSWLAECLRRSLMVRTIALRLQCFWDKRYQAKQSYSKHNASSHVVVSGLHRTENS